MVVIVVWLLFGISVLLALVETYCERDWPRFSFYYVVVFGIVSFVSLLLH